MCERLRRLRLCKLMSEESISPLRRLLEKSRSVRLVKVERKAGKGPVRRLPERSRMRRLGHGESGRAGDGMEPERELDAMSMDTALGQRFQKETGRAPVRELEERSSSEREGLLPSSRGKVPERELRGRRRDWREGRRESSGGRWPERAAAGSLMEITVREGSAARE